MFARRLGDSTVLKGFWYKKIDRPHGNVDVLRAAAKTNSV